MVFGAARTQKELKTSNNKDQLNKPWYLKNCWKRPLPWNNNNYTFVTLGKKWTTVQQWSYIWKNNNECAYVLKLKWKKMYLSCYMMLMMSLYTCWYYKEEFVLLTSLYFTNFPQSPCITCIIIVNNNNSINIMLKTVVLFLLSNALIC